MTVNAGEYKLSGLGTVNVVLGKNGSGKSTLLRQADSAWRGAGYVRYMTPERGGQLQYDGGIETNIQQNPDWGANVRRSNRSENFRQMSVTEFRKLETLVLRQIEKDPAIRANNAITFDGTVNEINEILDNIKIIRAENGAFKIVDKKTNSPRDPAAVSSGEAELVSLAIEVLAFAYTAATIEHNTKPNWLLFDEPDAHLHPDLQFRFMQLLLNAIKDKPCKVLVSTHSTAIVSALSAHDDMRLAFIKNGDREIIFQPANEATKDILPVFGAHPLSNLFCERKLLLVEGEDDERIWNQAYRTSMGKIDVWPCAAGDITKLAEYEGRAREILLSVYDSAHAISLRDRDCNPYEIEDLERIKRARLFCRNAENLIVTDDVLGMLGLTWKEMESRISSWIEKHPSHSHRKYAIAFRDSGWDRASSDIKELRVTLMALAESNKPWEIAVGQAIAAMAAGKGIKSDHSLATYLGPKLTALIGL